MDTFRGENRKFWEVLHDGERYAQLMEDLCVRRRIRHGGKTSVRSTKPNDIKLDPGREDIVDPSSGSDSACDSAYDSEDDSESFCGAVIHPHEGPSKSLAQKSKSEQDDQTENTISTPAIATTKDNPMNDSDDDDPSGNENKSGSTPWWYDYHACSWLPKENIWENRYPDKMPIHLGRQTPYTTNVSSEAAFKYGLTNNTHLVLEKESPFGLMACARFSHDNTMYTSLAQFIQAKKIQTAGHPTDKIQRLKSIMEADTGEKAWEIGGLAAFTEAGLARWGVVGGLYLDMGNLCKFTQNPELMTALIATGSGPIRYQIVADLWGNSSGPISPIPDCSLVTKNNLGSSLMMVRESLQRFKVITPASSGSPFSSPKDDKHDDDDDEASDSEFSVVTVSPAPTDAFF